MSSTTFIIDCHWCKAKVAAIEKGKALQAGRGDNGEPFGEKLLVGSCPRCESLLAGESHLLECDDREILGYDEEGERWSDIVRIYPKPSKTFISHRIPKVATESLAEADRSLQANANIAACAMLGRALEAVCRDILEAEKKIMLAEGIKQLKDKGIIDDRLYDWSQQLHAFRNIAAHPEESSITREDAEDLQTFVHAIIEYIYDLTDRYEEFKERIEWKAKKAAKAKKAKKKR